MIITPATSPRHVAETDLLARALTGHPAAIDSMLRQLGSAEPGLQRIMSEAVQESAEAMVWQRLLSCLALHRWDDTVDCQCWEDREISARLDASIVALFVEGDESDAAQQAKLLILRAGLADAESRIRTMAAVLLGLRGDAAGIDTVIEAARTGGPANRLQAIAALGRLKDERAGWAVVEALASDDEAVHRAASGALDELGAQAVTALLEALKSPKSHVRWHVVWALGRIREPAAIAGLVEALADDDYTVRWAAGDALAGIGEPAIPKILEMLARHLLMEQSYQVAYRALLRIGPREVQAQLQPLLQALRGAATSVEAPRIASQLIRTWERKA
jgi:HEAT repeat protein